MENNGCNGGVIFALFLLFVLVLFLLSLWIGYNAKVVAGDTANELCKAKGFETYVRFNTKLLGRTPYNLVCGTLKERLIAEGKIKAYEINNASMIIGDIERNNLQ